MDLDKTNGVWTKDYLNVTAIRSDWLEKHSDVELLDMFRMKQTQMYVCTTLKNLF